ncbi:GNAT family N-acetyltransferase [Actinopolymorpha sp. B9G3]|uniref:GNAT family N-acetyltransferase n=1 Tax=Actinopolymorpha sp. B9G3 TaxID=3158970 RepID=UPI0032D9379D
MRRDFGDGLVLRWSTARDTEDIAELNSLVFRGSEDDEPNLGLANTVRRHMRGDYPFMGPEDVVVVEDTRKEGNRIVASAFYLQEDWEFEGIVVPVARPDIVATEPGYRNRGLIRTALDVMHERSAREGRPVQAITGIPFFYRQFGYEYAVDERGRVTVALGLLPDEPSGSGEQYRLRQARDEDIPSIAACHRRQQSTYLVSRRLPDSFWKYHIDAEHEKGPAWSDARVRVIERADGDFCGFVFTPYRRSADVFLTSMIGSTPGTNLYDLAPALLRELKRLGEEEPTKGGPDRPLQRLILELGRDHPLYDALRPEWLPHREPPAAWYVRVPDLPGFLRLIAPILERRLVNSTFTGYSGELTLDFYRAGLRMCFENGKLTNVQDCRFRTYEAMGGFPPLIFLRLVFGHSSLRELRAPYPDIWVNSEAEALLEALFPKRRSRLVD